MPGWLIVYPNLTWFEPPILLASSSWQVSVRRNWQWVPSIRWSLCYHLLQASLPATTPPPPPPHSSSTPTTVQAHHIKRADDALSEHHIKQTASKIYYIDVYFLMPSACTRLK